MNLRYHISRCIARLFPDKLYLSIKFHDRLGYWMDWKNPQTYNEKLQWLKLYNSRPEYTIMVDKVKVKDWVAERIGEEYIIPTLGVWKKAEEVDFNSLPQKFVIKCNHNSGTGMYICKDKSKMDEETVRGGLKKGLQENYILQNREWPYKNVPRRILAEEFIEDQHKEVPDDFKVMCFDGKVQLIELHEGRFTDNHTQAFYDRDWNMTQITQGKYGKVATKLASRPALLGEMIRLSEVLAKNIPHVRVDWYIVNNHLFFGEMTFFDGSGFEPFDRFEDDQLLGSWITLPNRKIV